MALIWHISHVTHTKNGWRGRHWPDLLVIGRRPQRERCVGCWDPSITGKSASFRVDAKLDKHTNHIYIYINHISRFTFVLTNFEMISGYKMISDNQLRITFVCFCFFKRAYRHLVAHSLRHFQNKHVYKGNLEMIPRLKVNQFKVICWPPTSNPLVYQWKGYFFTSFPHHKVHLFVIM